MAEAQEVDLQRLIRSANRVSAVAVRAAGTMAFEGRAGEGERVLAVSLLLSRSGALRIRTEGPDGFLMASDGTLLRVRRADGRVQERSAWRAAGPAGGPLDERLATADLLDALLPRSFLVRDDEPDLLAAESTPEGPELRAYVRIDGALSPDRVLHLGAGDGAPARLRRFSPGGTPGSVVEYLSWGETRGGPPERVRICPGDDGGCVRLELSELQIDPPTSPEDWRLDRESS